MHDLVYDGQLPGPKEQRNSAVFARVRYWSDRLQIKAPIGNITVEMWDDGPLLFPAMSLKAAEAHQNLPVFLEVCREMHDGSDRSLHRISALQHIVNCYKIISIDSDFLSADESARLLMNVDKFLLHYNWLSLDAVSRGAMTYCLTIKFHVVWHIALASKYLNPKTYWCFDFEDFIGQGGR